VISYFKSIVVCAGTLALSLAVLSANAQNTPSTPAGVTASAAGVPLTGGASGAAPDAAKAVASTAGAHGAAATANDHADENPYGIKALWGQGDAVAKTTLLVLIIMSMASWYVIFSKYFEQAKVNRFAKAVGKDFWISPSLNDAVQTLKPESPFRFIADKGLESAGKHTGLMGGVDLNTWVTMGIQRAVNKVQSRMQDGLAVLATVGSTAPFVGLFGTVWGIYNALVKIGMSGQASIDKVAGPVGESLIMTAIGLAVAVPAVLGYNWLVRRNKSTMEEVHAFGNDLHSVLIATGKRS
jgi:biopolymer transport protein ExbB